jgi:protein-S-isoprenylcysteine O-methyltransferase Ste14
MVELNRRNIVIGIIGFLGLISIPSFLDHYIYFLTGQIENIAKEGRWDLVALNIIGFLLFLIPLNYRRKADWKSMSIYSAFIVSLFIEMYGVPLGIYLSTPALTSFASSQNVVFSLFILGWGFDLTAWMLVGLMITVTGMGVLALGWITIYRTDKDLVDTGIYSYSRHPQYIGIILIVVGWFIGWPTPIATVILPILVYTYYKLAIKEEQEVAEEIGTQRYQSYQERVPRFM